ncbi:EthD family reductase [Modestobacter roseus]|uniref:Uncharacterized protein (TIGR02118 family) n=1 Tax=Modestobacter roseus TaxID=1181884 RepID=A0A562IRN3_9ACTN|nr:EthD family reductase [Modestobacter roseus]MQA32669.1 EthD family reductase [Modestobacter roseus]TWH73687.1 uncharacterized protein (TIGR02118 family) [Modestobacter roseus]
MVHRLIVQYGRPTDPAEFDRHYREVHVGLAQAIPGLLRFTLGHPASMDPTAPAPYLIAELDFESAEAMAAGMGSAAGRAAGVDVASFATGGASMAAFDVDDVTPGG